jgi:hypothetical protein
MKRDPWHYGTWEGARDGMREDNLRLSLADKIIILEDMERIAVAFNRQRYREGQPLDPKIASLVAIAVAEEQAADSPPSTPPLSNP